MLLGGAEGGRGGEEGGDWVEKRMSSSGTGILCCAGIAPVWSLCIDLEVW